MDDADALVKPLGFVLMVIALKATTRHGTMRLWAVAWSGYAATRVMQNQGYEAVDVGFVGGWTVWGRVLEKVAYERAHWDEQSQGRMLSSLPKLLPPSTSCTMHVPARYAASQGELDSPKDHTRWSFVVAHSLCLS